MILFYTNNKNFHQKLKSSIKDEYDINKYYLIKDKCVKQYKKLFWYKQIKKSLKQMNLELSYNGYVRKLDKIAEDIRKKIPNKNLPKTVSFFNE